MVMFQIQGYVVEGTETNRITRGIPTFFLHQDVQGIMGVEHAEVIAEGMLNPTFDENFTVNVHATKMRLMIDEITEEAHLWPTSV